MSEDALLLMAGATCKVNMECLIDGKFPNGEKLTEKDQRDCKSEIDACVEILRKAGRSVPYEKVYFGNQLTLF
jgi:hypothetical protein